MRFLIVVIYGFLLAAATSLGGTPEIAHSTKSCASQMSALLTDNNSAQTHSRALVSYLESLLANQVIGPHELERFLEALDRDLITNPITEEESEANSRLFIHRQGLEKAIHSGAHDLEILKSWAARILNRAHSIRQERTAAEAQTLRSDLKIEMHKITLPPIDASLGHVSIRTRLTHPIEVMSTKVTQAQWVEIMGANPSFFSKGPHSTTREVKGKKISLQPNNPVENVSWWSVLVFANKLSIKHGLEPVYDLSGVELCDLGLAGAHKVALRTEAEIEEVAALGRLGQLKFNGPAWPALRAPNAHYYEATGFRLPTSVEHLILRWSHRTDTPGYEEYGDAVLNLHSKEWTKENSDAMTHPVGELQETWVDGKPFYDLEGNLQEWAYDKFEASEVTAQDSVGSTNDRFRNTFATDFHETTRGLLHHVFTDPNFNVKYRGFRLVRSVK